MLFDVTYNHDGDLIDEIQTLKNNEYTNALKRKIHVKSFNRILKTIDDGLDELLKNNNKLIWASNRSLLGHSSTLPKKHIDHLWYNVIDSVGECKNCLKTVGSLLRYRISVRKETWLLYKRKSDEIDKETNKPISVSEYWINNNFFKTRGNDGSGYNINDLVKKFNK